MKAFKVESMVLYLRWKVSYQIKCEIGRLKYRRNLHDCRVNIIQVNSNTSVLCLKVPCAFPINIRVLFCNNIRFLFDVFVTSVGRPHKLFKQQWQDLGVFFSKWNLTSSWLATSLQCSKRVFRMFRQLLVIPTSHNVADVCLHTREEALRGKISVVSYWCLVTHVLKTNLQLF